MSKLRAVLDHEMTVAEWVTVAVLLGIPYLAIGVIWSATHTAHLAQLHGADMVVSFLGSIVSWPVLLVTNVCMT